MSDLYNQDFHAWTQEQVRLLRVGRYAELNAEHLIEEIEDLGKRERRALEHRLGVLIGQLLKWRHQPDYPYRKSWRATINEQRRRIAQLLTDSPSLRAHLPDLLAGSYADGCDLVVRETPLDYDDLPPDCPFVLDSILDPDFWPQA